MNKRLRDKNTIINELVSCVSDILEQKAAELRTIADMHSSQTLAISLLSEASEIEAAVNLLRRRDGSWA